MRKLEEFDWSQKYRPHNIDDCILPERLKTQFREFLEKKEIPDLLLLGGSGIGKTTMAMAVLEEMGCDVLFVNGSLDRNIDTVRMEINQFASTVSLRGGRKYVIVDEIDGMSRMSQKALRAFMEQNSRGCGFILTANFDNEILDAIKSRCVSVDFTVNKDEFPAIAGAFMKRVKWILDEEKVTYEPKVLAELIKMNFPDFRQVINELQWYGSGGKIDKGILSAMSDEQFEELVGILKNKNFSLMRKWVATSTVSAKHLYRKLYDRANKFVEPRYIPQLVVYLADYQYKEAFVADTEINMAALLTEVMLELELK